MIFNTCIIIDSTEIKSHKRQLDRFFTYVEYGDEDLPYILTKNGIDMV